MTSSKSYKKISGWAGLIAIVVIFGIFFAGWLSGRVVINYIKGPAMSPTLNNGDLVISSIDKKFERFDLVTYKPTSQQKLLVGRVIGTPTELVEVKTDALYINGGKISSLTIKD